MRAQSSLLPPDSKLAGMVRFLPVCLVVCIFVMTPPVLAETELQGEASATEVPAAAGKSPEKPATTVDELADKDLTVEDVTVEGNRLVPTEHILNVVKTRRGDRFDRDQVVRDLKAVNGMGYFDDRSLQAVPELAGTGVLLKIRVQENAPVTQFTFQGNSVLSNDELSKIFADQLGKPQNLTQLSQSIDKVEQIYHDRGFTLARVVDVKDDPDGSVQLNVDEGVINSIQITGNKKTKDFIVRSAIKLKPGTVYNEKQLTGDLRKLFGNGYFQDIRRSLSPSPTNPDRYDLKVEVDERRTGSVGLGGGVDTVAGPFGSFSFSDSNFRGRGQVVQFNSQVGSSMFNNLNNGGQSFLPTGKTFQVEASFIEPNIRGTDTSMAVSGFARDMGSFMVDESMQRSIGTSVTFSKPLKKGWSLGLGLMGEQTSLRSFLSNTSDTMLERATRMGYGGNSALPFINSIRDKQLQGGLYVGLTPSLVRDTRDGTWDPHKGSFVKLTAGPSLGLGAPTFLKAGASVSKFVPVGKDKTLAFNVQGGSGVGGLPQFAGYRLGGWNGIRGYRAFSDLGSGTGMLMASAEFRMKLPIPKQSPSSAAGAIVNSIHKNVRVVAFADGGVVAGNSLINNFYQRGNVGASVGIGLRLNLPYVGLVRLDYGIPILSTALGRLTPRMTVGFGDKF
jgi:outer membrane protein insertion porin family